MPTAYIKKVAKKKGISVDKVEAKWSEAKNAVDKSKYDSDDAYWAVVTTVFKKMIGEADMLSWDEYTSLLSS